MHEGIHAAAVVAAATNLYLGGERCLRLHSIGAGQGTVHMFPNLSDCDMVFSTKAAEATKPVSYYTV